MSLLRSTQRVLVESAATVATIVASALLLAGCGDDGSPGSAASDPTSTATQSDGDPTSAPPTSESPSGPTVIPDDFPLTSGWAESDGSSEYRLTAPSRDHPSMVADGQLTACDRTVDGGDPDDRLTTRLDWGSATYVREVQLFASVAEATAFVDSVEEVYRGCPTTDQDGAPPTMSTAVGQGALGDQSLVITRVGDMIYRVVLNVVRIGTATIVDIASDEGTSDTVMDLATETRENLADVIGATYELQSESDG